MLIRFGATALACLALALACGAESTEQVGPHGVAGDASDGPADSPSEAEAAPDVGSDAVSDANSSDAKDAVSEVAPDAAADSGACALEETLLDLTGHAFTPTSAVPSESHAFGKKGVAYCSLRIRLDVDSAALLPVNTDAGATRLEHIFFGLERANQASSANRYLMGTAAVRFTNKQSTFKMYGRVAFAQGWQSYTSWQVSEAWASNAKYQIDCTFDAAAQEERCTLLHDGVVEKQVKGSIPYIQVSDLASAFRIELGSPPGGPELTAPFGWTLSNLVITALR